MNVTTELTFVMFVMVEAFGVVVPAVELSSECTE